MGNMDNSLKRDVEKSFNDLFKAVDINRWQLFIKVQKELLNGAPVSIEDVAKLLKSSIEETNSIVDQFGEKNENGKVVAFAGISVIPTPHSFKVNGKQLYTWCAADALIFPSWLNICAEIESADPISKELVKLVVDKKRIAFIQPETAYVSWVSNIDTNDIRNTMCKRIHFFVSEKTANEWLKKNPNANILPAEDLTKFSVNPMECC